MHSFSYVKPTAMIRFVYRMRLYIVVVRHLDLLHNLTFIRTPSDLPTHKIYYAFCIRQTTGRLGCRSGGAVSIASVVGRSTFFI